MKNAIIYHGTGGTPKHFWFPFVKSELDKLGFEVSVPQLPDTDNPDIKKWLPYALEKGVFTKDTVLIGHSAGCPLILSILEKIDTRISQRFGKDFADRVTFETITKMMDTEDWSWFDADGNPSPLLNHNLPE